MAHFLFSSRQLFLLALSNLTFERLLLSWSFFNVIVCNSLFTVDDIFPLQIVGATFSFYAAYSFVMVLFYAVYFVKHQNLTFKLDTFTILIFLVFVSMIISLIPNFSYVTKYSPYNTFLRTLFPIILSVIYIQVFTVSHIRWILILFVTFALLNVVITGCQIIHFRTISTKYDISALFADRNLYCRYLTIVSAFLLIEYINTVKNSALLFNKYIVPLLLIFLCIIVQQSRSGYALYFLTIIFVLTQSKLKQARKIIVMTGCILTVLFAVMTLKRITEDRMDVINYSDIQRISLNKIGFDMFKSHPFVGIGFGLSERRFEEFYDRRFYVMGVKAIHNIYLYTAAEQGIIGLVFFLLLNGGLIYRQFHIFRNGSLRADRLYLWGAVSLSIHLLHGFAFPNFTYEGVYWIIVAASIILLKNHHHSRHNPLVINSLV